MQTERGASTIERRVNAATFSRWWIAFVVGGGALGLFNAVFPYADGAQWAVIVSAFSSGACFMAAAAAWKERRIVRAILKGGDPFMLGEGA